MLKILQAKLQQYVNHELADVQVGFRKGRGTRGQIASIHWVTEKAREFQKNIYFCFIDYAKAFDCVDHNKLWKILKEMGIPDHLTCLLRTLYAGQEAIVRTGHGTMNWEKSSNFPNWERNMPKPLTVWITINWKILKEMGIPEHLTCLLRNLYAGQEAAVRTGHGTTDWFQIET